METDKSDAVRLLKSCGRLKEHRRQRGAVSGTTIMLNLTFRYKYDVKNRLCEKTIPGADPQRFYYDNRDLLVMSQDGNQRLKNPNIYYAIVNDLFGRKVETGWVWTSNPVATAATMTHDRNTYSFSDLGDLYYYSTTGNRLTGVRGRPLGTTKPTDSPFIWDTYYYNAKGEMDSRGRGLLTGNSNWHALTYNAAGKLTQIMDFYNGPNGRQVWFTNEWEYDKNLRSIRHNNNMWYPQNGQTKFFDWVSLSQTKYNYLDQVTEKNIGSNRWNDNTFLQSVDYTYSNRGWLTTINQTGLSNTSIPLNGGNVDPSAWVIQANDFGKVDLFGQIINYNTPTAYSGQTTPTPQYNGNISQTTWQVAGRERQGYNYTYDDIDRLTNGQYFDLGGNGTTATTDNKFGETLTYDKRGNILSLVRKGLVDYTAVCNSNFNVCGNFGAIDNLAYSYNDSNQVTKIIDNANLDQGFRASNLNNQYTYDANGNMISDKNKGITSITYNELNLPELITFGENGTVAFVYASTGAKLRKTVTFYGKPPTVFDYLEEAEYVEGILHLVRNAEGSVNLETCSNCSSNDPFLETYNPNGISMKWVYEYTIKDHLGNTRVTFADIDGNNTIDPNTEVRQINHYYPYGANMEGNWNGLSGSNLYQYNGKQWNGELGWFDYGARFYDPMTARWVTVDPECESGDQPSVNPYHYVYDNPIKNTDPDGREPQCIPCLTRALPLIWRLIRALESYTPSQAQSAQQLRNLESLKPVVAVRDNLLTTIKPVMMKKGEKTFEAEPVPIYIDAKKHPESAKHAEEAEEAGTPLTGTIDRKGKDERRKENLKGKATEQNKDRDEMPPAVVKSDGKVSVKNIDKSDNRGAGSSMGHQMRNHPDGTKVKITVKKE